MSKPADVYFLRGQGGAVTSEGVDWMAETVVGWKVPRSRVRTYNWSQWETMREDVNARARLDLTRLCVCYSMGGNAMTWVLGGVAYQGVEALGIKDAAFDHVTFLDPTWASVITPISPKHLHRGRHYKNHSLDPIGHAALTLTPDFPPANLEVVDIYMSHLWVDVDASIRAWTLDNLHRMMIA